MNTEIISFAAIGLVLIILGLVTWKKQTTVFLHSYHYKKVKEEDIPAYTRLMGIGQIIIGAGFCLTAVLKLFVQGPFSWAFLIAGLSDCGARGGPAVHLQGAERPQRLLVLNARGATKMPKGGAP